MTLPAKPAKAPRTADVAAIVVAYLSADHLRDGLPALLADPSVARVVVIDNSADSDSRLVCEQLADRAQGRLSYVAGENVGFARGCNRGAAQCTEDFLLFLNPDVLLARAVASLKEPLRDGRAAISAGLLLTPPSGINIKPLASPRTELRRSVLGASRRGRAAPVLEDGRWLRAPQLDGAFLLMTQDIWRQLGGFDEQFELYYEDVDLCRRAASLGGCVAEAGEYFGGHSGGASFERGRSRAYTAMRVSRLRYLRKHFGGAGALCGAVVGVLEWLSRTVSRQPEGRSTRAAGVAAQFRELRRPGSVWVLGPAAERHAAGRNDG